MVEGGGTRMRWREDLYKTHHIVVHFVRRYASQPYVFLLYYFRRKEVFRQARFYLAELSHQATFYLAELYRQIAFLFY